MEHRHIHKRPLWWPENEPFPPHRDGMMGNRRYRRFFFRIGCALVAVNAFILLAAMMVIGIIAHMNGIVQMPLRRGWFIPVVIFVLLVMGWFLIWGGRSFRHFTAPMLALFEASGRVAEGDYTVRVIEQGSPEVRAVLSAFNVMATRLETSDQQRRSLLADVTHELRTPLTVIRGNLEGMLDGIYSPDETRLKSTLEEVQILSHLVDDLRTLALAESGAIQFHRETVDLAAFVKDVAAAFQTQAQDLGVDLGVEAASCPGSAYLDAERMHQVLTNLVVNALRYTPRGGTIRLRCESAPAADGANRVVITVEDSGPGIKAEDLPHVFERFYKASDSGGMGLGLAIVKNIVEVHGGKVSVESVEGQGTKFSISLPGASLT